jgi:hypothetical protein
MGNVKATRWLDCRKFFLAQFGPEGVEKVLSALSPEDQAVLSKPILPISWINYGSYLNFIFTADKLLGKGDKALIRESAVYTANQHFKGLYRIFVSLTSPQFVGRKAAQVWRLYFDVGKAEQINEGPNSAELKLSEYPDIPLHHDLSHTPFMETILAISGAKNPKGTHPKCMARGDDHCLWQFHWS